MATSPELLCRGFPTEFRSYFEYCRALRFDDRPDYSYLKRLFSDLFQRKGYEEDHMYDWTILNMQHERTRQGPERSLGGPLNGDGDNAEGEQVQQIQHGHQGGNNSGNKVINDSHLTIGGGGGSGVAINTNTGNKATIEDSKDGERAYDRHNHGNKRNTTGTQEANMYNSSTGNINVNRFPGADGTNGQGSSQQQQFMSSQEIEGQQRTMGSIRNSLESNGIHRAPGIQNLPNANGNRNSSKDP